VTLTKDSFSFLTIKLCFITIDITIALLMEIKYKFIRQTVQRDALYQVVISLNQGDPGFKYGDRFLPRAFHSII